MAWQEVPTGPWRVGPLDGCGGRWHLSRPDGETCVLDDRFAIADLLAPVVSDDGADGVAGPDVRGGGAAASGLYLEIKDARAEARLAEREALASGDPNALPLAAGLRGWATVVDGAVQLLGATKDLQVAAWLTEAWLRTDGFPGVAAGFALMTGLVELFWDEGLHPLEDEDGIENRVAPLFGLFGHADTGTLLQPLKLLPLTDNGDPAVALWTVETLQAQSIRHDDPEMAEELAERRRAQMEAMELAIHRASPEFADAATKGIAGALAALDRLMAAIDGHAPFGRFGSQVTRPLEDAAALLRLHGPNAAAVDAKGATAEPFVAPAAANDAATATVSSDATVPEQHRATPAAPLPMTRERALATLLEVAAFFDRNEPQSLVGESLRHIVRRANLTAEGLLAELLPDGDQRALFLLRAGIGGG